MFQIAVLLLCAGCSYHGRQPDLRFSWGPVNESLGALPDSISSFAAESRAARLREELLTPRSDAPGDRDWRYVRGTDKGPTIIGVGLKFDLSEGDWSFRAGLMRRGAGKNFGPQLIMTFDDL
jgi:hypothetical protein